MDLIAKEGRPFIAVAFIAFFVAFIIDASFLITGILFLFLIFCIWFFRDPERPCPGGNKDVLCPADGQVVAIDHNQSDRFLEKPTVKVSIFMSPLNVHVNRAPLAGKVEKIIYNPGKFFNAKEDKASLLNEQNALIMRTDNDKLIVVNQIAGFIARRIVCRIGENTELDRGERFGMIRFGSRVDIHLPPDSKILVGIGERVYAGDTIIGKMSDG